MQTKIEGFIPKHNEYYGEIYITTNLINGKQYIGQTVMAKKRSKYYYGSGVIIKKAIKKYDRKNFKRETLEYCNNKSELDKRERYWIKKLNTLKPNGYNLAKVGGGTVGVKYTEEQKKYLSKIHTGKKTNRQT